MKSKLRHQIQPEETVSPEQVQGEINCFALAVDSYPAHVAEEPGLSFQQHLSSFLAATREEIRSRRE
jgi:hypothetical protein